MTPQEQANDLFNRALGHFRQRQFIKADALLVPLLSLAPHAPPALNLKAAIAREMGLAEQALPYAVQAVELAPEDPVYCCNLGQILADLGHNDEALGAFENGLKLLLTRSGHRLTENVLLFDLARIAIDSPMVLDGFSASVERYAQLYHSRPHSAPLRSTLREQIRSQNVLSRGVEETKAHASVHYLIDIIGLFFTTPAKDNQETVETLLLPWLQEALQREWFDFALWLELQLDLRYVHQTETEEHFARHYRTIAPLMNQAGQGLRRRLPQSTTSPIPDSANISFIVHQLDTVGPNLVLLDALSSMDTSTRSVTVYVLNDVEPSAYQQFVTSGARIVSLSSEYPHLRENALHLLLELRRRLASDEIAVALWTANIAYMSFAFGLRLAPVQIWWSMKYHSIELEDIDGYFAIGSQEKFKRIGNRDWRCIHGAFKELYAPALSSQARTIRQQYPVKTLLGCMGRVEKLDNPQYLDAVTDILKARPDTGFLWSGQSRLPSVQEYFEKSGVADRCFFVGWINTRLYAQVLDICLDTFPFGGGITVFECMAAEKPVVFHLSPESMETGVPMVILPLLNRRIGTPEQQELAKSLFTNEDGDNLFLCANDQQEYITMALRAIDSQRFRDFAGQAARTFVEMFIMDTGEMARTLLAHIEEVVSISNQNAPS